MLPLGQIGRDTTLLGRLPLGSSRRHVLARAGGLGPAETLKQQLQDSSQQAIGAVQDLGAKLATSGSGMASSIGLPEELDIEASAPHWGTQLLSSTAQQLADSLAQYLDALGAWQPVEEAQRALQQLQGGVQLPPLPAAPGAAELQAWAEGVVAAAKALEDEVVAAVGSEVAALAADALQQEVVAAVVGKLASLLTGPVQLALPLLSTMPNVNVPGGKEGVAVVAAVLAGLWAVLGNAMKPPPPPPSGPGGGAGGSGAAGGQQGQYLPTTWNPDLVGSYFAARPTEVALRGAQVAIEVTQWGVMYMLDSAQGRVEANSPARAAQLRRSLEKLGPAYVKVAQALSTRVDLLSPPYLAEIERLQDQVQPFPDAVAVAMISQAYGGRSLPEVFTSISPTAVAAASLGQVYRGVLRPELGGLEVAVKVRRPGVLESVALDLHIMRQVAVYLHTVPQVKSDWAAIIDKWAEAFFAEMDFQQEADNARRFKQDVEEKQLTGVVVPEVHLATRDVLVTQWIEGEKLSESNAADVRELCNTLLSAYLVQLLETGWLHADPHPGNLLRTPDGKVAILDFGLMQQVPPDYSLALVEYIAHLSVGDYDGVVEDLVALGFLPEGGDRAGLAEPLGVLLEEITAGGGAANVNIDLVMSEMDKLSGRYPFQIPPYFALILRTFSVIEGIALRVDPNYAIVSECFPYLSRRLLTDNHPRARQALRDLLYGGKQHIDLERMQRMADGFGNYTVAGLTEAPRPRSAAQLAEQQGAGVDVAGDRRPLLSNAAKEALRVVFSSEGSYAQELLVAEAAATVDAASRQLATAAMGQVLGSAPALAGLSAVEALGPWRSLLLPLPTPLEVLSQVSPALQPSEGDLARLATARGVVELMQRAPASVPGPLTPSDAARLAEELGPLLPELLPGVAKTGDMFARELLKRAAARAVGTGLASTEGGASDGLVGGQ